MKKKYFVILTLVTLVPMSFVLAAKKSSNPFKPGVIRVQKVSKQNTFINSPDEIAAKILEATALIKDVQLAVGDEKISYTEKRVLADGGTVRVSEQRFKDYEREIALVLMNKKTGKLDVVKIIKHGGQLMSPSGYTIELQERMNGIRWNYWATQYRVTSPKNTIVLLNTYPVEKDDGTVEYFTYSPYTPLLDSPQSLRAGAQYLEDVIKAARADLRKRQVMSHAVPGKLVVDILPASYFSHLPFLEQSDLLEALRDTDYAVHRVLGTLGLNKSKAWTMSSNFAGANGWIQFTDNWRRGKPGTYSTIARLYAEATLDSDFQRGAADHINSMKAAILLYDNNLALLVNKFGETVVQNPRLEEFLAASYNGPPSKVISSIKSSGINSNSWFKGLFNETEGYIAKLRLLNANQIPQKYLD